MPDYSAIKEGRRDHCPMFFLFIGKMNSREYMLNLFSFICTAKWLFYCEPNKAKTSEYAIRQVQVRPYASHLPAVGKVLL